MEAQSIISVRADVPASGARAAGGLGDVFETLLQESARRLDARALTGITEPRYEPPARPQIADRERASEAAPVAPRDAAPVQSDYDEPRTEDDMALAAPRPTEVSAPPAPLRHNPPANTASAPAAPAPAAAEPSILQPQIAPATAAAFAANTAPTAPLPAIGPLPVTAPLTGGTGQTAVTGQPATQLFPPAPETMTGLGGIKVTTSGTPIVTPPAGALLAARAVEVTTASAPQTAPSQPGLAGTAQALPGPAATPSVNAANGSAEPHGLAQGKTTNTAAATARPDNIIPAAAPSANAPEHTSGPQGASAPPAPVAGQPVPIVAPAGPATTAPIAPATQHAVSPLANTPATPKDTAKPETNSAPRATQPATDPNATASIGRATLPPSPAATPVRNEAAATTINQSADGGKLAQPGDGDHPRNALTLAAASSSSQSVGSTAGGATVPGTGPALTNAVAEAAANVAAQVQATPPQGGSTPIPITALWSESAMRSPGSLPIQTPGSAAPVPHDQVAVHIQRAAAQGLDRIQIRLHPAELGQIDVRLQLAPDGSVKAVISVDRAETYDLLQRDSRGLERALQDAGLKTDAGSLSFNLRGEDQRGLPERHQGTALGDSRLQADGKSQAANETPSAAPAVPSNRILDIRV